MKIAILHRYPISQVTGTNASFVSFLEDLRRKGHTIYYITYKNFKVEKKPDYVKYLYLPFTFNRGNSTDKIIKTLLWMIISPLWALRLKLKEGVSFFYCDDSVPYYAFLTKLLVGNSKVIMRLGDLQSGYNFSSQGPVKNLLFKISLFAEKIMWGVIDGIVAISEPFKTFVLEQGISPEKVAVVVESIDLERFKPLQQPTSRDPIISFHGALLPQKGLDTLLRAFRLFLTRYPRAQLIIAGGGTEEKRLSELSIKLGILDRVEFTGWYDHEKLASLVGKSHVAVVMRSANMANNFVVTTCLLENWAFEKPVIVPDLAAFRNVVEEGQNGIFFEPGNDKALYDKMLYLFKNKWIWRKLGTNGRVTAKNIFDKEKIADAMVKTLEKFASDQ